MGYTRVKFDQRGFDELEYKRYFRQNQPEYLRIRLRSVLHYYQGKEFEEISTSLSIHHQSVRKYVNLYIIGGFKELCKAVVRPQRSQLSELESMTFKEILLTKRPIDMDLEGNIWTGKIMCQYLKKTYKIDYKSGIYDLLERLNLTHQKAHADYGNAKPSEQIAFINDLKQTIMNVDDKKAVVKFDEFSICEKPSAYYGWAEKNSRPKFVTDEKKESEPTVF